MELPPLASPPGGGAQGRASNGAGRASLGGGGGVGGAGASGAYPQAAAQRVSPTAAPGSNGGYRGSHGGAPAAAGAAGYAASPAFSPEGPLASASAAARAGGDAGVSGRWGDFLSQQQPGTGAPGPHGRKVSPAEQRRLASNAAVDRAGAAAAASCACYLQDSISDLSPFMAPGDVVKVQRAAARSSAAACSNLLLDSLQMLEPPPALQAQLRPYQLEGLRWLATMRHHGASCILADEMARPGPAFASLLGPRSRAASCRSRSCPVASQRAVPERSL